MALLIELLLIFVVLWVVTTQILFPILTDKLVFPIFRTVPKRVSDADLARKIAEAEAAAIQLAVFKSDLLSQTQTVRTEATELERAANNIGKNI